MTKISIKENAVSFKVFEKKIFEFVCLLAREYTKEALESYDDELSENRDKKKYRNKGKRKTSVKTIYGEVEYERRVYQTKLEDGRKAHIYLLDEAMDMDKIGLISTNLAEKIAYSITELPYRETAKMLSETTGQTISAGGVWNVSQKLGERIATEEENAVKRMKSGKPEGERIIPLLFEEMDGVWLSIQDSHHRRAKKQEMKVFTMYEGWDAEKEKEGRSTLVEKSVFAGMESSREFHEKREAHIQKKYNPDEIGRRVLNGDGGSWIKEPYDDEAIYQLDRYHIYQAIIRNVSEKKVQRELRRLFDKEKYEEMFESIRIYAQGRKNAEDERGYKKAKELYKYLHNNREGLLPYHRRGIRLPAPREGLIYKNMGIQETQNCTLITLRMKHRRMRWSVKGANNLVKILCRKENKELSETIERYTDGLIFVEEQEIKEPISASKTPKKEGKGLPYMEVMRGKMVLTEAIQTPSRKAFKRFVYGE